MENQTPATRKYLPVIIIILILAASGAYLIFGRGQNNDVNPDSDSDQVITVSPAISPTVTPVSGSVTPSASPTRTTQPQVKTFNVSGKNFSFTPSEIKVKKGDRVKIVFTNSGGTHDWVLDEFNVKTPRIQSGQTATVEFTADKTGTFEYYCSVGDHRAMGMKGNLVVQ